MSIPAHDNLSALQEQVQQVLNKKSHCSIQGQGTRPNTPPTRSAHHINMNKHSGVIHYEPSELVIKVRAGTPIKYIQKLLKDNKQQLGTDFPDYGGSTIGGAIATGETGSGRPFLGGIRDQVLGLGIINGKAQVLNFGGQVMKNVAGYDLSRLLCGSMGQLALITDVTLKVMPLRETITIELEQQSDQLLIINQLAAQALPITAAIIDSGKIKMRLSGSANVTAHAVKQLKAKVINPANDYWPSIHNKSHAFFQTKDPIWQVRLAATQTLAQSDSNSFIDWCGHQRYIKAPTVKAAKNLSVSAFKNGPSAAQNNKGGPAIQAIHKALKLAFDEHNLFNRHA